MKKRRGIMKTVALTLFAAVLGVAQNQSSVSTGTTPVTNAPAPTGKRPAPAAKVAVPTAKGAAPAAKAAAPAKTSSKAPSKVPDKKAAQAAKPSPGQKASVPAQSIPAGAMLVEPFLYRYTDANGKTWMYRKTPFGMSKWEESSTPAPQPPPAKSEPVVVTDLGDSVRFEKKTPFGSATWVHKKSELTDEEKALVGGQQGQSNPAKPETKLAGNQ